MKTISLGGRWELRREDSPECWPATVPGSVYSDLLRAGALEDPFWRDNENRALPVMEQDFRYGRHFTVPEELLRCHAVYLRCEGLDTVCRIYVNGTQVGCADNMHRTWEFDVRDVLKPGDNEIEVCFTSPTRHIRGLYEHSKMEGTRDAMRGFPLLRKAHCMFGWDWGPRLPDMGIWRAISLVGVESARLDHVRLTQTHKDGRVSLRAFTSIERLDNANLHVAVTVTTPDGRTLTGEDTDCTLTIEKPQLWWPNGLGAQPLYTVQVELRDGTRVLDSWTRRIGLRTMTVHTEKDEWGESFAHCVNGVPFFAMGADYIPEDNILSRVNPARTRRLLEDAAQAHFNVIRVWGGGYYPDDFFFDICDELGLVVWQDFMFACAGYDLTREFESNIRAEVRDNVRRIRHHACLGLWCGNNEMEMFAELGLWVATPRHRADYIKMYEYVFPQILSLEDPDTFYWPASPSSGGSFDKPNDPDRGDVHYWDVWHGNKPFTDYRNYHFRYVSEFGFQSFPDMKTIESFTEPRDRNVFSYVMEKHQRNAAANGRILSYLSQLYLYPRDLDTLVYASQLLQAQAIQYGVEHWRRNRGRCMGAVVWQLNDCWPVASWASIDYYGRWKALHYFMKRFFAPVLISCHEEGILSQTTSVNAEPFELKKSARLNVSNETHHAFRGQVCWALRRPDATVIREGSAPVEVPAFSSLWLPEEDFAGEDAYGCYFEYRLEHDGAEVGSGSVLFCPPKHFPFEDPALAARIEGDEIVVSARGYARMVELRCDEDVVLADNFFDMHGGERRITILRGQPKAVTARSVYDIQ